LGDIHIERDHGAALFADKVHDGAHNPRLVALPKTASRQLHAYLTHLAGLSALEPSLSGHVRRVLAGDAPLFFKVAPNGGCAELDLDGFKAILPKPWRELPLNWGRHWTRTRGIEAGIRPELVNMQLGHLEAVGYPFSGASPTEPWRFVQAVSGDWERLAQLQGWEVFHGLKGSLAKDALLPPLQSWSTHVHAHLASTRETAAAWDAKLKSELRRVRTAALARVLDHPDLIAAGITERFSAGPGRCDRHDLKRADFERIRDELFEAAGDNSALAMAMASAVCRVARVVNRRSRQPGETPGPLLALRRPLDNAFVPKMMTAVRQVYALRSHVATLVSVKAGEKPWDLLIACAHAVLALCLFGYCESFEQALGVLRHRSGCTRSRVMPDVVLVPFGPADHEVVGLRRVAAIVIAKLAKNFPGVDTPSAESIGDALANLLPDWAVASRGGRKSGDWVTRLFETCAMANRYELSPAARMANAIAGGSTPAHIEEQAALIDGDPAGVLRRSWEVKGDAAKETSLRSVIGGRTANARSQYNALCAVFPGEGDTPLPTTGRVVHSNQSDSPESRRLIIEELRTRLDASRPEEALQPIVHVLTQWVVDMLVNGTPMKANPALSSVETYLSRIGGVLTHVFGQSSLEFIDDVELEEAYLSAIEAKDEEKAESRSKTAATSIHFHAFAIAHAGFPDIDLSQIRLYLRQTKEPLADARLILASERQAAMEKVEGLASTPIGSSAFDTRLYRQAVFAMGLYAWRGLRRSEPIGMHFRDVAVTSSDVVVRIRSNHTRRVKTQNARRVIRMPLDAVRVHDVHLGQWVETERSRLGVRRLERALVFGSAEAPFSAEQGAKVADVCLGALRESTGRPGQRLHALRHLVGIEQVTPVFLTPGDHSALSGSLQLPDVPTMGSDLALPRDLQAQVVPLGHGNPKTTIQHYHHLPWLLRSRSDERLGSQYVNRATLAPLLGVTLHAMDFAVKKHPDRPRGLVWLDIAAKVRPRPSIARGPKNRRGPGAPDGTAVAAPYAWQASELSKVLDEVARVGDLEKVLLARGAPVSQGTVLRRHLAPMERRLGRRVLVEDTQSTGTGVPKRVLRPMRSAQVLNVLLDWFDRDVAGRRSLLASLADDLFEHLHPKQGDRIVLSQGHGSKLEGLLADAGMPREALVSELDDLGMYVLRVRRPGQEQKGETPPKGEQYLGLVLKRLLVVIRLAFRGFVDLGNSKK
jgi:integrase